MRRERKTALQRRRSSFLAAAQKGDDGRQRADRRLEIETDAGKCGLTEIPVPTVPERRALSVRGREE